MHKIAHNVLLVFTYPEKWKNLLFASEKNFLTKYNFDLTQHFDFILNYKIYLN